MPRIHILICCFFKEKIEPRRTVIKSKERISEFGEVFTSEREVNAMLDLVSDETHRIDSRFLEPACGDGNFLIEVLHRKLEAVGKLYSKNQIDYEKNALIAVSSIYGIDILRDNVEECINRLTSYTFDEYARIFKKGNPKFLEAIKFVCSKNILHGDATTLMLPNSKEPIVFSEWSFIGDRKVKRTEYTLENLVAYQPFPNESLFSDSGEKALIPHPLRTFKLKHYLDLDLDNE